MTLIAEVLGHLDLEPALEHVAHQLGQQPAVTGERDTFVTCPGDQLGRPRSIDAGSLPAGTNEAGINAAPSVVRFVIVVILSGPQPTAGDPQITPLTQSS